ncbi:MAG: hypothetical protein AABX29_00910 [Nanoarchaeota archaeon]
MDWREFFKFSGLKLVIGLIIFILSTIIWLFGGRLVAGCPEMVGYPCPLVSRIIYSSNPLLFLVPLVSLFSFIFILVILYNQLNKER